MKSILIIFLLAFACLELTSCKKDTAVTILGKWNIINDSKTFGIGPNIQYQNYIGVPGDHFDFRTDGNLYTKEGANLDTLSYTIYPDNKITIASFGWVVNGVSIMSDITSLTSHLATIHAPNINNPGGVYERTLNLSR